MSTFAFWDNLSCAKAFVADSMPIQATHDFFLKLVVKKKPYLTGLRVDYADIIELEE
jgi:hypothetical protein